MEELQEELEVAWPSGVETAASKTEGSFTLTYPELHINQSR